jgi:SsrA-binding protein
MGKLNISNKKAHFNFHIEQKFIAGIVLTGTEVKSIRANNATISEAYCIFEDSELYLKNMHVSEWKFGGYSNHDPVRPRKLLLQKKELKKLKSRVLEKGFTIVPIRIFLSERGLIKLEIGLAVGKKDFDKRDDIKKRDIERETKLRF